MSQDNSTVRLTLRLPENVRDRLLQQASKNARSMNGEIIAVLEQATKAALDVQEEATAYQLGNNAQDLESLLEILSDKQKKQLAALVSSLLEQDML